MNELDEISSQWNRVEDAIVEISFQIYKQGENPGGTIVSELLYNASRRFKQRQEDILNTSKQYVFTKDRTPFPVLQDCTADQFEQHKYELYAYQPYDDSTRCLETIEDFYNAQDGELIVEDTLDHLMFQYKSPDVLLQEVYNIPLDENNKIKYKFYKFSKGTSLEHIIEKIEIMM